MVSDHISPAGRAKKNVAKSNQRATCGNNRNSFRNVCRAFEAFLEAEFLRQGYVLNLPQNERGKIPLDEDLGRDPFLFTRNFANLYGSRIFGDDELPVDLLTARQYHKTLPEKILSGINDERGSEELQRIISYTALDLLSFVE